MNLDRIGRIIKDGKFVILYVKSRSCGVCNELLPKITEITEKEKIEFINIYIEDIPEITGRYSVFTAPTIIMFVMGKEVYREGRFFRPSELNKKIYKYKNLIL